MKAESGGNFRKKRKINKNVIEEGRQNEREEEEKSKWKIDIWKMVSRIVENIGKECRKIVK